MIAVSWIHPRGVRLMGLAVGKVNLTDVFDIWKEL